MPGFPTGFWHSAQHLDDRFLKLIQNLTKHPEQGRVYLVQGVFCQKWLGENFLFL